MEKTILVIGITVIFLGTVILILDRWWKNDEEKKQRAMIFRIVEAPAGPKTDTDKLAQLFPDRNILEYPGSGNIQPVLEILGGNREDHFRRLYEAGFKVEIPAYNHPSCPTWVNPPEQPKPN